jgi:hypothetical protein
MKIYLAKRPELEIRWHEYGGAVVVAASAEEALVHLKKVYGEDPLGIEGEGWRNWTDVTITEIDPETYKEPEILLDDYYAA